MRRYTCYPPSAAHAFPSCVHLPRHDPFSYDRRFVLACQRQVLAGIFGKKAASGIVSGAGNAKRRGDGGGSEAAKRKKVLASSRKVEVTEEEVRWERHLVSLSLVVR